MRTPLVLVLAATALFAAVLPAYATARLKAEFEDHPGLLLGCAELVHHHPATLVAIAEALDPDLQVFGLVSSDAEAEKMASLLAGADLDPERIHPVILPTKGMWVRDYGPLFVSDGPRTAVIDTRYLVTPDDGVPSRLATRWGLGAASSPLWCEGGHLAHNGEGLLLVSSMVARLNHLREGMDGGEIAARLRESLPFTEAHWIRPMPGEPTGHLDMFLTFIAEDRVVVASMDPEVAPERATHLDDTARRLASLSATPLEVLRVPTPAPLDGIWYTYTNVILIADQVLVPIYPELGPGPNDRALQFWREALPEREVEGIDSSSIIQLRGALHCISLPLPVLPTTHRG